MNPEGPGSIPALSAGAGPVGLTDSRQIAWSLCDKGDVTWKGRPLLKTQLFNFLGNMGYMSVKD